MATPRMPANSSRDAPKFDPEKPEELIRFFKLVEDLFKTCQIQDVKEKKDYAGRYTDSQTEREWQGMEHFEKGTWEEWKKEIISSYPAASSLISGSLRALKEVCAMHRGLTMNDVAEVKSLKRKFNAESKKLVEKSSIISNRELVNMFMNCLDERYQMEISTRLSSIQAGRVADPDYRAEDPYKLKDVMEAAELLAESAGSTFFSVPSFGSSQPSSISRETRKIKEEVDEIKQVVAGLQDRVEVTHKSMNEGMSEIKQALHQNTMMFKSAMQQGVSFTQNAMPMQTGLPMGQEPSGSFGRIRDTRDDRCFYCHESGHIVPRCPQRKLHLDQGKIMEHDGKLRMFDGSWIPSSPREAPIMDRVEAQWNKKNSAAQMYLGPEEEDEGGMYTLPPRDQRMYSTYSNAVQDSRDTIIDRLRRQVEQLQHEKYIETPREPSRRQQYYHEPSWNQPQRDDRSRENENSEDKLLDALVARLANREQYAATRSGQQHVEKDFHEVRGRQD